MLAISEPSQGVPRPAYASVLIWISAELVIVLVPQTGVRQKDLDGYPVLHIISYYTVCVFTYACM